jgi:hypothetical protein
MMDSTTDIEMAFYRAFADVDLSAMQQVWHNGNDVYCIHPNGPLITGYVAVMRSWRDIFAGAAATRVKTRLLQVMGEGDFRVHLVEERIGSGRAAARIIAANHYLNTTSGWLMTAHHASLVNDTSRSATGGGETMLH